METIPLPPLMMQMPTAGQLEFDIEATKQHAASHPEDAQYDQIKEEIFEQDLVVLNDPKNRGIDRGTLAGAEAFFKAMESATQGLSEQAQALLRASCENGGDLLSDGTPNDPNQADQGTWFPVS